MLLKTGMTKNVKKSSRMFSSAPKIVSVDFKKIRDNDKSLNKVFEEAYNDDGLGVMVINNIPHFPEHRKACLPIAQKLANLPKNVLESLEAPEFFYGVGWSHGKEKFMGKPDFLKGSFYANPCYDKYSTGNKDEKGKTLMMRNKWPAKDLPELEIAFKKLGSFINDVGIEVAKNLDRYIKACHSAYDGKTLERTLVNSKKMTGRLLHYFPVDASVDTKDMKWCGWHNDHGTITGLCSAMYLDPKFKEIDPSDIEDTESGLFAMNRHNEQVKIRIPQNSLAFQIGESAQIHSGGLLKATPHAVISKPSTKGISRNTMAVFLEPNYEDIMSVPPGMDPLKVHKADPTKQVPLIETRWVNGQTFKQFETKTFENFYNY